MVNGVEAELARRRADVEERRAKKRAEKTAGLEAQWVSDLESIEKLEDSLGIVINTSMTLANYVQGCPYVVGIRGPSKTEYKRYFEQVNRASSTGKPELKIQAHEQLAAVCWVYPPKEDTDAREKMLEANAGLLASVGNLAAKLAELRTEEEGKG